MDPDALAASQRRVRSSTNTKRGDMVEQMVAIRLRAMGFLCVERIYPAFKKLGGRWLPIATASGDFKAVERGGRAVHCEVKYRPAKLAWSDLQPQQIRALDAHAEAGALTFLAWVHRSGMELLPWRPAGFGPGTSIDASKIPKGKA